MKFLLVVLLAANSVLYSMEDEKARDNKLIYLTYDKLISGRQDFLSALNKLQKQIDQDDSEEYKNKNRKQITEIRNSFRKAFGLQSRDFCDLYQKLNIAENEKVGPSKIDLLRSAFDEIGSARKEITNSLKELKELTQSSNSISDKNCVQQAITNLDNQICAAVHEKMNELDKSLNINIDPIEENEHTII